MLLLKLAARNLLRNPSRSAVMITTVALSAGALFFIDGFNFGLMRQVRNQLIHFKYGYGQVHTQGYLDKVYEKPWEKWINEPEALHQRLLQLPEVANAFGPINFFALLANSDRSVSAVGRGGDAEAEASFFNVIHYVEGKNLTSEADGVTLGVRLAKTLNAKVGSQLTILASTVDGTNNSATVKVVGIFESGIKEADESSFRMQLKLAQNLLNTPKVELFAIALREDDGWPAFAEKIRAKFPELGSTSFEVLDKVFYQNSMQWLNRLFFEVLLVVIFLVTFGIANTISFIILERSAEIGNLRANGDSSLAVLSLLLCEGAVAAVVGALIGIGFACLFNAIVLPKGIWTPPGPGVTLWGYIKVELRLVWALLSAAICLLLTLLATFLTGWRTVHRSIGELLTTR